MNYKKIDIRNVGNKIKLYRIEYAELTQEQLARKCKLTSKSISDIECNKCIPTLMNIDKICKALNIRVENIIY